MFATITTQRQTHGPRNLTDFAPNARRRSPLPPSLPLSVVVLLTWCFAARVGGTGGLVPPSPSSFPTLSTQRLHPPVSVLFILAHSIPKKICASLGFVSVFWRFVDCENSTGSHATSNGYPDALTAAGIGIFVWLCRPQRDRIRQL